MDSERAFEGLLAAYLRAIKRHRWALLVVYVFFIAFVMGVWLVGGVGFAFTFAGLWLIWLVVLAVLGFRRGRVERPDST